MFTLRPGMVSVPKRSVCSALLAMRLGVAGVPQPRIAS